MTKQELNEAYNALKEAQLTFKKKSAEYINQIKDYTLTVPFEFINDGYKYFIHEIFNGMISGSTEHKYYMDYTKVYYTMRVNDLINILSIEQINELLNNLKLYNNEKI